ncbi:MAG: phosphoserine phosphatase SerB [Burkholderiaceae bacterium]
MSSFAITAECAPIAAGVPGRVSVSHPQRLPETAVRALTDALGAAPLRTEATTAHWHPDHVELGPLRALADRLGVDLAVTDRRKHLEDFRLIAFDMDSTLITIECIDEIADFAGLKDQVAAITEATMRGEIKDFAESLSRRVALLRGLPQTVLATVYAQRLALSPGVETLLDGARAAGLRTLLVSGGFTFFTERLRERLDLDFALANELEIIDGKLTGRVLGDIVDAERKRRTVAERCAAIGASPSQAIVVGDGANDLPMMSIAGVSVAYRAKPLVRAQTDAALNHGGLDAILRFFG